MVLKAYNVYRTKRYSFSSMQLIAMKISYYSNIGLFEFHKIMEDNKASIKLQINNIKVIPQSGI